MILGKRLRAARVEAGLTLERVEELTGIDAATLSMYENEQRNLSSERLKRLANLYNVSIDWLMGRTEYRRVLTFTEDQVREAVAHYNVSPADDPRVLEIARQLCETGLPPEKLANVMIYARFLANQERAHPAKNNQKSD